MKLAFIFMSFLVATVFSASAYAQQVCYEAEKDVTTKKIFTKETWDATVADWSSKEPLDPGLIQLIYAWDLYSKEEPIVKKIKGDKRKHCYMGCRISQHVSLGAAVYVAWYKEQKDLTDCNAKSYFELRDHEVTLQGAEFGQESPDSQYCMDKCSVIKRFK